MCSLEVIKPEIAQTLGRQLQMPWRQTATLVATHKSSVGIGLAHCSTIFTHLSQCLELSRASFPNI